MTEAGERLSAKPLSCAKGDEHDGCVTPLPLSPPDAYSHRVPDKYDFHSPLRPPDDRPARKPTPAPAWVALLSVWLGLISLVLALAIPFVPGSEDPAAELMHLKPYSMADRVLLVAIYLQPAAIFLGIVVLWQMRKEPRPLPDAMLIQRLQAWVGILLALAGAAFIYIFVALRGPG